MNKYSFGIKEYLGIYLPVQEKKMFYCDYNEVTSY